MNITIEKTVTEEIQIAIPCFWKREDNKRFVSVVDDKTAVSMLLLENYTAIAHGTPEELKSAIKDAYESLDLCSEEEFLNAYNKTVRSISLKPELSEAI